MGLIEKLENLVNMLLIKLGELIVKLAPNSVKNFCARIAGLYQRFIDYLKGLPLLIFAFVKKQIINLKSLATSLDYKAVLLDTYKKAMEQYKAEGPKSTGKLKTLFITPFLMLGQWLQGLSAAQSVMLLAFSAGSVVAIVGIGFSGQKLVKHQMEDGRAPASVGEEIAYERPDYYKKQTRHFDMSSIRLPVYVAKVNEIRSVDIDFTATISNRNARMFLEKHEFQLRDHLVLQIEPSVASFPLEDEGKEILRRKLINEVNDFLKNNEMEGEVTELKITYVLAN